MKGYLEWDDFLNQNYFSLLTILAMLLAERSKLIVISIRRYVKTSLHWEKVEQLKRHNMTLVCVMECKEMMQ